MNLTIVIVRGYGLAVIELHGCILQGFLLSGKNYCGSVNPDDSQLARRLRDLREQRGLSQVALAERSGLDGSYISLLERGKRQPTIAVGLRLAYGLGLGSLEELLGPLPTTSYSPFREGSGPLRVN